MTVDTDEIVATWEVDQAGISFPVYMEYDAIAQSGPSYEATAQVGPAMNADIG
jgi:hypothetical protein